MNATLCHATVNDVQTICKLALKTFYDTYERYNDPDDMKEYTGKSFNEEQIKNEILDADSIFLLVSVDMRPAGYSKLKWGNRPGVSNNTRALEIARFYANKEFIGKGIGKLLMEECLTIAKKGQAETIWLDVWQQNTRAIKFYEKWGFKIVGDWFFILGKDKQDDYIMERFLDF
ncbi:MAG TPA: GNAT family N-acetyltransferase [Chitinophagaceae bacterium]|jgi:ribosomal protein S18 acetylase RimI-like enzyme